MEFGLIETLALLDMYLAMGLGSSFVKWVAYSNTPKEERQDWMSWFVVLPIGFDIAYTYAPEISDRVSNAYSGIMKKLGMYKNPDDEITNVLLESEFL